MATIATTHAQTDWMTNQPNMAERTDNDSLVIGTYTATVHLDSTDNDALLRSHYNLNQVLQTNQQEQDNTPINFSPYYDHEHLIQHLAQPTNNVKFKILSLNCQSLNAKFDQLMILIAQLNHNNVIFDAICLQETWIKESELPPVFNIKGYQAIHQARHCSGHGGLLIFLKDSYKFKIIPFEKSAVWESQFINIDFENGNKDSLLVGNIYRPPHKVKDDLDLFSNQFTRNLLQCSKYKNIAIAGDFNINLLDVNSTTSPAAHDFPSSIISNDFLPKITLPTRISESSSTLIDNFFCKLKNDSTSSGVVIHKISDHQAYFTCLPIRSNKIHNIEKIKMRRVSQESIIAIGNDIRNATGRLDLSIETDPNVNYEHSWKLSMTQCPNIFQSRKSNSTGIT
ncbi:hypothetical protein CAPTEDRAFT_194305 [Capitella teleta]|uniref:Endonuclease/exonuclease/phosphatase domain-containing protein n=1 Tax=Capitella teleta TaxID=283909 RepID=R7U976_CAPTE|nr:hypothetical protein CAPTEDRAFT_194305 [Capitella teleta]|eukprot:ELU02514.1 hypothetical protein CAPTEDRAFT_194305 [Capitella teleta]